MALASPATVTPAPAFAEVLSSHDARPSAISVERLRHSSAEIERRGFRPTGGDPHCTHIIAVDGSTGGVMNIFHVIPQLRTTDLAASIPFYTEPLGFT